MWTWALAFLLLALVAAILGYGAGAVSLAVAARPVFYAAVALFLLSLMGSFMRKV